MKDSTVWTGIPYSYPPESGYFGATTLSERRENVLIDGRQETNGPEHIEHIDRGVCEWSSRKLEEEKEKYRVRFPKPGFQAAVYRKTSSHCYSRSIALGDHTPPLREIKHIDRGVSVFVERSTATHRHPFVLTRHFSFPV